MNTLIPEVDMFCPCGKPSSEKIPNRFLLLGWPIWQYTGPPLTGWQMLDNNPSTTGIVVAQ